MYCKIFPKDISNVQLWKVSLGCEMISLSNVTQQSQCFEHWSLLEKPMRYLNLFESKKRNNPSRNISNVIDFCERKKIQTETLIRAFEYLVLSWSAWRRMREDFELISITTLTRLTSKKKTLDMFYMKNVFSQLDKERQKHCVLIIDEVYVKSILQ